MRFDIGPGGAFVILVGLVGLSGAVFGLGLVAGHELASQESTPQEMAAAYPVPESPATLAPAPNGATANSPNENPAPDTDEGGSPPPVVHAAVAVPASRPVAAAGSAPRPRTLEDAIAALRSREGSEAEGEVTNPARRVPEAPAVEAAVPPPAVDYAAPARVAKPAVKPPKPMVARPRAIATPGARQLAAVTPPTSGIPHPKPYSVQIDAIMDRGGAQQMISKLKTRGFEAYLVPTQLGGQTWYRVRVGRYATPEEARNAEAQLHQQFNDVPHTH